MGLYDISLIERFPDRYPIHHEDIALKPLTVTTPFFNNSDFELTEYFKMFDRLTYPRDRVNLVFLDNMSSESFYSKLKKQVDSISSKFNTVKLFRYRRLSGVDRDTARLKMNFINIFNRLREEALDLDTDMVIIGSDCVIPPVGLHRMNRLLYYNAGVGGMLSIVCSGSQVHQGELYINTPLVTAFYYIPTGTGLRSLSDERCNYPNILALPKTMIKRIIPVDAVGTGFSVISRDVAKSIPFTYVDEYGEDVYYCIEARRKGYNVLLDSTFYDHLHYRYRFIETQYQLLILVEGSNRSGERISFNLTRYMRSQSKSHGVIHRNVGKSSTQSVIRVVEANLNIRDITGELIDTTSQMIPVRGR